MEELAIIEQTISHLNAELPAFTDVRTPGGDTDDVELPLVTVNWSKNRLSANGANPHAGFDYAASPPVQILHYYYRMNLTFEIQSRDEKLAYNLGSAVESAFTPFERRARDFDPDTYEWDVGAAEPGNNPIMESDWYEHECEVSFGFKKESTREIDTLDEVQQTKLDGTLQHTIN